MSLDTLMSVDDIKREGREKDIEMEEAVSSILKGKNKIILSVADMGILSIKILVIESLNILFSLRR